MTPLQIDPQKDGVDHINVYSKGATELGRLLSNFAHTPFNHALYGHFESVEGFWYWAKTGCQYDEFRDLYGFMAKKTGQQYDAVHNPNFEEDVKSALVAKVEQNPQIQELMQDSTLPLYHYYNYGGKVVDQTHKYGWQLQILEELRAVAKGRLVY